jgi:hypothetical protein
MEHKEIISKNELGKNRPTVLTWFSTHYYMDDRDWQLIKKYGNPYHPLWGYYKNDNESILEKQVSALKRAKIDVIAYDVFATYKWTPRDIAKDKALPVLNSILENQGKIQDETWKEPTLKYCIFFENYIERHEYEDLNFAISYLYDNFFESDFYFKSEGKPFIIIFGDDDLSNEITRLRKQYKDCEINQVFGGWMIKDGWQYTGTYPQKINPDWMPVSPGYDSSLEELYMKDMYLQTSESDIELNKKFQRWVKDASRPDDDIRLNPIVKASREDGIFYRKQLERVVKYKPKYIFISSWNDWQYQCQIEPSEEYGFKYVDITAEVLSKAKKDEN